MNKILVLTLLFIVGLASCSQNNDDLEVIKEFEKNNEYFKAGLKSLHFTIETSPIEEVESEFNSFIKNHNIPLDAKDCRDGVYTGTSPDDAFDYNHTVTIEIKDEKIISIDYNEINEQGVGKEEDEKYNEKMSVAGTSPSVAYPKMEKELLAKQNMNDVDAVSGATYSLYRFRYALAIALMKAKMESKTK